MTSLLIKLFVKNSENVTDIKVRTSYGNLGAITGMCCNLVLFVIKITIGLASGAFSIIADAFNNLTDLGSSLITLLGFKLAAKPADKDHPFGHGRMEYVSAFVVSALIIMVGFELFKGSLEKIFTPELPNVSWITIAILVVSIAIKLWMGIFNRTLGKKISSDSLVATAQDSFNDCISTSAVLVATLLLRFANINVDAYVGLAVAVFIVYSGVKSVKDTLDPLLGQPADKKDVEQIEKIVSEMPYYLGTHDFIIHNYGPGRVYCSLHVEVPQDVDILACHEEIDDVEKRIKEELGIEAVVHMDPVAVGDPFVDEAKEIFKNILKEIDEELKLHDFRIVMGNKRTNVIFDVVLPHDHKIQEAELKTLIQSKADRYDKGFCTVITVDREF
ncbi:MAG: cation transporter [Clostridia bacterium]|nr:cation transporter [Clostridia bacterium]